MLRKLFSLLLVFLCCSGCSERPAQEQAPKKGFVITNYASDLSDHDYYYTKHPERIIALWQNSIETLLALEAGPKIIAAAGLGSESHLRPDLVEAYKKIPIRSRQVYSQEATLLMEPDFILGWLYDFSGKGKSLGTSFFWEQRGVNVYMNLMDGAEYQPKHVLADELRYIGDVGKIVGKEHKAQELITKLQEKITSSSLRLREKPKVLILSKVGKTLAIYTPRTLAGDIATSLGAQVLGADRESIGEDEFISYEDIVTWQPDIIFVQSAPERDKVVLEQFAKIPVLRNLECARQGNIYCLPFYTLRSPGIRVVDAVELMAAGMEQWQEKKSK